MEADPIAPTYADLFLPPLVALSSLGGSASEEASGGRVRSSGGPILLFGGAGILLGQTIALLAGGAQRVLQPWVVFLTWLEMAIDGLTMAGAVRWFRSADPLHARLALRTGTLATLLHAARVAVFVAGRTGPWKDLDVRPEARADHDERWTWGQVVFAGTMSVMGVVGMLLTWRHRRAATVTRSAQAHDGHTV